MHSIHRGFVAGALAGCIAALGCGAVMAQPTAPAPAGNATGNATGNAAGNPASAEAAPSAATPGLEAGTTGGVSHMATQTFINDAVYANRAEIAAAHYAIGHTQSDLVKQFAQKMIHDHTMADDQLTMIAMAHNYTTPLGVSDEDRAAMTRLALHHGQQFNAEYSRAEERDHREAVALFKRAEQNPHITAAVRAFARMTLPILEDHLRMANQLVASQATGNRSSG